MAFQHQNFFHVSRRKNSEIEQLQSSCKHIKKKAQAWITEKRFRNFPYDQSEKDHDLHYLK